MTNDRLIDRLVGDLKPVRRRRYGVDIAVIALLCAIELAVYLAIGPVRRDMPGAMQIVAVWWRLASLGLIALVGVAVAIASFNPAVSPRRGLRLLISLIALCLAAGWLIDASRDGWPALATRIDWRNGLQCVYEMTVLAIPALLGLGLLMRRGASTDSAGTALAVGISAAAWGAFVFVFACPFDDPLYIAIWYCVGCGLVTLLARLALPIITRW
ncbi:NrsF family protein [Acidisphaera sp. L21]|uniref:NrsF family protein n=1 Tax=Acidisphaera sp. L21 TaxID=1641851 RepID=UPI00131D6117|nr:DUF1109 domain-containing protein [Acidisphaera sp. L21]